MINHIEVGYKKGVTDAHGRSTEKKIKEHLEVPVKKVETRNIYFLEMELTDNELTASARELFVDPIIQEYTINKSLKGRVFDFSIIVKYKPGVTDNVGKSAETALRDLLDRDIKQGEGIYTAVQYLISGIARDEAERISRHILANDLIADAVIQDYKEWESNGIPVTSSKVQSSHQPRVNEINLNVSDRDILEISRKRILALNLEEMNAIKDYFGSKEVIEERKKVGLGPNPTDVELEVLAQTWSEHCHHKVFNGTIRYTDEYNKTCTIHSVFKTYIKKATEKIDSDWLLSVFHDNAGVIRFNDHLALVYKVETHNSPSALDPYGGAMTGIVGVNRDPFGTGLGSRLIANVWGYCLGNPFWTGVLPEGLLHPRRIRDGVHRGVIEGGNQSGIPTMRGWEIFEDRYMGKPLVFCGTLGEMPLKISGISTWGKEIKPDDEIVMVGGRVGKDGIHGATFSSEELHSGSPVQAVQIGDPITQKKMTDMLLEARDRLLYRAITDNGAGGLSSSVGEMALLSGGCEIDLSKVPLKYSGLDPWEIMVSEAQERMTLAVASNKIKQYLDLSNKRRVESTPLGRFTNNGKFHVRYGEKTVAYMDLNFLHNGDPPYNLKARFIRKNNDEPDVSVIDHTECLKAMLGRLNICSMEKKARQYDHEVQGRSIIKPFCGRDFDVPTDASVMLAEYGGREGILLTEGINPFYSDIDTYWMAASVIDLAVRRIISTGGEPDHIAGLDNFCWPNVVKDMPERSYKLAQLVRACQGLYDFCTAYDVPLISGKDSMSNDCTLTDPPISVPPTLLFSVVGRIEDVGIAVTMDVKAPEDLVYILGETNKELGGSEFYRYYGERERNNPYIGNQVPRVRAEPSMLLYRFLNKAIQAGYIRSSHTPAMGGLGVALVKKAIAGGYGLDIDLICVPGSASDDTDLLYSESNSRFIVTVAPEKRKDLEAFFEPLGSIIDGKFALIGNVREDTRFRIKGTGGNLIIDTCIEDLKKSWQETL